MTWEAQLRRWLTAAYGLTDVGLQVVQRDASALVRVETGEGVRWLRVSTGQDVPLQEVEEEARVVASLHRLGVRVAAPVPRQDAAYAGEVDAPAGRCAAVLFDEAPGTAVDTPTSQQAEALGALVARIHVSDPGLALAHRPPIGEESLVATPLRYLEPWFRRHGLKFDALSSIAAEMIGTLGELRVAAGPAIGLCHGDVHLENVRYARGQPTIFDFECCATGPWVYDLACYWRKRIFGAADPIAARREWDALLTGYRQVRQLGEAELAMVPALATLRAIWVAALPAFPGMRWGRDWLEDVSYLDAHLDAISRFAERARRGDAGSP